MMAARGAAQALALYLGLLPAARRSGRGWPRRERWRLGVLFLVAAVSGWIWPVVAGMATGVPNAYVVSEPAWRNIWSGSSFVPVLPWFYDADFWFGRTAGPIVLALLLGLWVLALLSPALRRVGPAGPVWASSRAVYLLLEFSPQSSTFRLLMPLAPAGGALADVRATRSMVQARTTAPRR